MHRRTILSAVMEHEARNPDRVFCRFQAGDRSDNISYGDLLSQSAAFARAFQGAGITELETVIIVLPHRPEMFYSFFGAMLMGAVPSFMPFPSAKQDHAVFWSSHRKLLDLTGIRVILTYKAIAAGIAKNFDGLGITVLYVEDIDVEATEGGITAIATPAMTPDDVAFLQHSSGTTGLKKGVLLSHGAVLRQIDAYAGVLGFGSSDIIVSWLPLYHDMGLIACLMMTAIMGSTLVLLDPFEWVKRPAMLLDAIDMHRGTFTFLPNFAFLHIARAVQPGRVWDLSCLRGAVNCSEPCKPQSFEKFTAALPNCGLRPEALQVCYAMAENVFAVSHTPRGSQALSFELDVDRLEDESQVVQATPGRKSRSMLSCGVPLPGTSIRIVNAGHADVPSGHAGQIAMQSNCLFEGYNKLPELTAEKLVDGWYYTGDLGFMQDGELFVLGRQDDLMIIYGRNYYAHNVEEVVTGCPGIVPGRVVAFTVDNPQMGTREAVVLVEADGTCDVADVRRTAKTRILDALGLAVQHIDVVPRNTLVKSTAGKISRDQNMRKFMEGRAARG